MHKVLSGLFPKLELKIKWPNDIFLAHKKVGGIITNYFHEQKYHLIGIGINSNNGIDSSLKDRATSLCKYVKVENEEILAQFCEKFQMKLPKFISNGLKIGYLLNNSYLINKKVILRTEFADYNGVVVNYLKSGAIVLKLNSGLIQPFIAGSIIKVEQKK